MAEIFKNIQKNQTVYILDKAAMELKEGTVKDNQPHIGSTYTMSAGAQMMRDVTIESEGKQLTYTIPEQLAVTYAADLVLSTDREGLSAEVERMKQAAEQQLANTERNKRTVERAEQLLAELNPHIRERQETERRFKSIEGDISGIRGMMKQLLDKLS